MAELRESDVLLEFRPVGQYVRVSAIDPRTNTEIVVSGPASAGQAALRQLAIRRLNYVLKKKGA